MSFSHDQHAQFGARKVLLLNLEHTIAPMPQTFAYIDGWVRRGHPSLPSSEMILYLINHLEKYARFKFPERMSVEQMHMSARQKAFVFGFVILFHTSLAEAKSTAPSVLLINSSLTVMEKG
jgi:hypothetical protein